MTPQLQLERLSDLGNMFGHTPLEEVTCKFRGFQVRPSSRSNHDLFFSRIILPLNIGMLR